MTEIVAVSNHWSALACHQCLGGSNVTPFQMSLTHLCESFAAVRRAVEGGENVNEVEAAGNTPLHCAAYEGWLEGVELLLSLGAKARCFPLSKSSFKC